MNSIFIEVTDTINKHYNGKNMYYVIRFFRVIVDQANKKRSRDQKNTN